MDGGAQGTSVTAPPAPPPEPATSASSSPLPSPAHSAASSSGPDRTMDDIRAVVTAHREVFRACYDESLKSHPGIKGAFVLRFVVNPDGSVKSAEADPKRSDIHAPDLEMCASKAVKRLKFPPSHKGMESTVNYPFDFHPRASMKPAATAP
jgi:TonB family protein